jgi:FtsP/CotA-like multicopper oxidase with cupredoxin domain
MHLAPSARDYSQDGVQLGAMEHGLYTTVVNGRGIGQGGEAFPLQVYPATPGARLRMRVVHAGAEYPYYVSVDAHRLFVVASDGYEMNPIEVRI